MSTQNKTKLVSGVSQGFLNSKESIIKHKNLFASTADYYTEWTTAKSAMEEQKSEKHEDSLERPGRKSNISQTVTSRNKLAYNRNREMYASTTYNEIYNMADLFNLP